MTTYHIPQQFDATAQLKLTAYIFWKLVYTSPGSRLDLGLQHLQSGGSPSRGGQSMRPLAVC